MSPGYIGHSSMKQATVIGSNQPTYTSRDERDELLGWLKIG